MSVVHPQTESPDSESCNLGSILMTLEDQPLDTTIHGCLPSKIPKEVIETLHTLNIHQNKNAFVKNKMEGLMMDTSEVSYNSNKLSLFRAIDVFLLCDFEHDFSGNQDNRIAKSNNLTRNSLRPMSVDQAVKKVQCMVEILPLMREVRLFNFKEIRNFLRYFYNL